MVRRLTHALRRHGFWGTIALIPRVARDRLSILWPDNRLQRRVELEFDRSNSIDTAGRVPVSLLDIPVDAAKSAVHYAPSAQGEVAWFLDSLGVDLHDYVFIDFGSGKGRVLLIASHYPFREIIGVEFSRTLHKTALKNIANYSNSRKVCASVTSTLSDARQFSVPVRPSVYYFYHPFEAEIMGEVVARIEQQNAANLGRCFVLYLNPQAQHVFESSGKWNIVKQRPGSIIYQGVG